MAYFRHLFKEKERTKQNKGQPEQKLGLTENENEKEEIFLWFLLPLFTFNLRIPCNYIFHHKVIGKINWKLAAIIPNTINEYDY